MEAPAAPGPLALNRPALAVTLVFAFVQDALYALIFLSYMNHYLLDVLRSSAGLPGYTLALYGTTKLLSHPIAGRLLDRTSPRTMFRAAAGIQAGAIVLLLTVHTLGAFLLSSVLLAAGSATMWPLIYDTVARTQSVGERTRATGALALVGYLAVGVGFATGVLLADFAPWRAAFVLAAALIGLPLLLQGTAALDSAGAVGHAFETRPVRTRRRFATFGLVIFLDYAAISSLAGVYGPYARLSLGISLLTTTLLLAPAGLAAVGSLYVASRFSKPERRFLEMSLLYATATTGAAVLATTTTPWVASMGAIPLAAGAGGIGGIIAATMIDFGGATSRGLILGTLMSVEGLGSVAGPAATATLIDLYDPRAGLAFIGAIFAALVVLTIVAFRQSRRESPPADRGIPD
jgi:MFS family permease